MILFRVRRYGTSDWTEIHISNGPEAEDDEILESSLAASLENLLSADDLHAQRLSDEGKWEDLD